jgi:hypothetical protein
MESGVIQERLGNFFSTPVLTTVGFGTFEACQRQEGRANLWSALDGTTPT